MPGGAIGVFLKRHCIALTVLSNLHGERLLLAYDSCWVKGNDSLEIVV